MITVVPNWIINHRTNRCISVRTRADSGENILRLQAHKRRSSLYCGNPAGIPCPPLARDAIAQTSLAHMCSNHHLARMAQTQKRLGLCAYQGRGQVLRLQGSQLPYTGPCDFPENRPVLRTPGKRSIRFVLSFLSVMLSCGRDAPSKRCNVAHLRFLGERLGLCAYQGRGQVLRLQGLQPPDTSPSGLLQNRPALMCRVNASVGSV